jgi:hypothetical protein
MQFLRGEPYFFKKKNSFARWRTCYGVTVSCENRCPEDIQESELKKKLRAIVQASSSKADKSVPVLIHQIPLLRQVFLWNRDMHGQPPWTKSTSRALFRRFNNYPLQLADSFAILMSRHSFVPQYYFHASVKMDTQKKLHMKWVILRSIDPSPSSTELAKFTLIRV